MNPIKYRYIKGIIRKSQQLQDDNIQPFHRNMHSAINDITVQTLVKSLSTMIALHRHNLQSRLFETKGRQSSADLVGDSKRQLFAKVITEVDPFDMTRTPASHSSAKSKGSPFAGLSLATMRRFVANVKEDFQDHFPQLPEKERG